MAAVQRRSGPYNVGWFGLLQPIDDGIKLIKKQLIIPQKSKGIMFILAPIILFAVSISIWAILPWDQNGFYMDFSYNILFQFYLSNLSVFSLTIAGWAGNSKYSFLGALRNAAQMLSYEIVIGGLILIIVLTTQTLS